VRGLHSLPLNLSLFHTIFVLSVCVHVFLYLSLSFSLPFLFSPVSAHSRLSPSLLHPQLPTPLSRLSPVLYLLLFFSILPLSLSGHHSVLGLGFQNQRKQESQRKNPVKKRKNVNGFATTFTRCSLAHAHTGHTLDTHTHYLGVT